MTDQEPMAAAILAALNAALPATVRAYDLDEVPDPFPQRYVSISLYRDRAEVFRGDGGDSLSNFFLETTYRAESVSNCRELRRRVGVALEGQVIADLGFVFNQETQPIAEDAAGGWSGTDAFRFA